MSDASKVRDYFLVNPTQRTLSLGRAIYNCIKGPVERTTDFDGRHFIFPDGSELIASGTGRHLRLRVLENQP